MISVSRNYAAGIAASSLPEAVCEQNGGARKGTEVGGHRCHVKSIEFMLGLEARCYKHRFDYQRRPCISPLTVWKVAFPSRPIILAAALVQHRCPRPPREIYYTFIATFRRAFSLLTSRLIPTREIKI